ncbi:MAG: hypothetical protein SGCHY_001435 [Lobulomycetales sp.]
MLSDTGGKLLSKALQKRQKKEAELKDSIDFLLSINFPLSTKDLLARLPRTCPVVVPLDPYHLPGTICYLVSDKDFEGEIPGGWTTKGYHYFQAPIYGTTLDQYDAGREDRGQGSLKRKHVLTSTLFCEPQLFCLVPKGTTLQSLVLPMDNIEQLRLVHFIWNLESNLGMRPMEMRPIVDMFLHKTNLNDYPGSPNLNLHTFYASASENPALTWIKNCMESMAKNNKSKSIKHLHAILQHTLEPQLCSLLHVEASLFGLVFFENDYHYGGCVYFAECTRANGFLTPVAILKDTDFGYTVGAVALSWTANFERLFPGGILVSTAQKMHLFSESGKPNLPVLDKIIFPQIRKARLQEKLKKSSNTISSSLMADNIAHVALVLGIRVSTLWQMRRNGLVTLNQLNRLLQAVADHGLNPVNVNHVVLYLEVVSSWRFPFQNRIFLKSILDKPFPQESQKKILVTSQPDRLTRRSKELEEVLGYLDQRGITWLTRGQEVVNVENVTTAIDETAALAQEQSFYSSCQLIMHRAILELRRKSSRINTGNHGKVNPPAY